MNQGKEKWKKIERARKFLGLPLKTTRKEIVERYRQLAKKYHPDQGGDGERMKELNEAYEVLISFCDNFPVLLKPSVESFDPAEWWFQHFGEDPVWGKFADKKERG